MSNNGVSRRHFFYGALLGGAVPAGGYGSVPALRALGYKPFYDKLNVASIGCGGQGAEANKYVKPMFRKGWELKL
jgi:hypothetical protein